jgi:hypothetical protein
MRMHVKESSDKYEMKWKVGMALMFNEWRWKFSMLPRSPRSTIHPSGIILFKIKYCIIKRGLRQITRYTFLNTCKFKQNLVRFVASCKIWRFHSGEDSIQYLLGCDTMQCCYRTTWDGGSTFLWNVGILTQCYTTSQPRKDLNL